MNDTQQTAAVHSSPRGQRGLTTVEYAVAGGLIAATVVAAFVLLGGRVNTIIHAIITSLGG
ncbi:MAG TPA: hypothetical protein VHE37_06375 [Nevskiaceae bacterium]|nr:hypothetical protein [Nevskiaceae bacterium]